MSLAYSEDPDEMPCNAKFCIYNAAFHQGLPCLLRQKKKDFKNAIFSRHYNP